MRVHVMDLQAGDELEKDVYNDYGLLILSKGTVLDAAAIAKLLHHNIGYVATLSGSPLPSGSVPAIANEETNRLFETAYEAVKGLFAQALEKGVVDEAVIEEAYAPLARNINCQTDVVSLLLTLNQKDEYTYQHCVQVGMISYFLAKWSGRSEADAAMAGKAGYLHDIGKSRIPDSILNKPGKLTEEEFAEIKLHPVYGHEILIRSLDSSLPAVAALQHHERLDGSGYPSGLRGDAIHPISKIVAIADIYSAMISSRVYQKERDLLHVLKELHRLSFSELDPILTHLFIQKMLPNLIGKQVVLDSGMTGNIVMTNPTDYFRPLIRVQNEFIDLSQQITVQIEKIYA
ncbi:HD-GYP domain-containing protein [Paenibacillus aurantius]|uniref:HD-GYP domain-containing protein n=1 Tax=Paenibacillus aurantius TaxID=2918900 RepID=A0AA96RGF5_9BACL|nr:HD-GYP domain-containing protein [Paenibacillus aurantius]WNQ09989.1 HD-GYP domain-containing protein [Paenibacillus aurantius]